MCSVARVVLAAAAILPMLSTALHGQRLMEIDGIQLRGSTRVVAYAAATCQIREGFADDDQAYDPANRGQPLDVWQLDFSVYNQCCPTNFSAVRVESVGFWDQAVRSGVRTGPGAVFARTG